MKEGRAAAEHKEAAPVQPRAGGTMRVSSVEENGDVLFVISDFAPENASVFEDAYYSLENGSYVKRFPRDTENICRIRANWEDHAEEMFSQMSYTQTAHWEEALLDFADRVTGTDIDWWLTGSCATCLRGVGIQPHDVDIMLHSQAIDKVNELLGDCIVEPIRSSEGWVVAYFGVAFLGARVDLAFDPADFVDDPEPADFGLYAAKNLEEVSWRGHVIKVPPLELQFQVNKRRGRDDRVAAIEEYLSSRS